MKMLPVLEEIINYKFKSTERISIAMVHPGVKKHDRKFAKNFERLEFLGDRVLGLSLAGLLYQKFPQDSEGDLAVRISVLAGTDFLIDIAKKTKLIECFSYPKDLFVSKNKTSSSIADMVEAVLGSVFLDSGFESAREVVARLWGKNIGQVTLKMKDSKTRLQELLQGNSQELPLYRLVKMSGEAHDPVFEIEVSAGGIAITGFGNTKKEAEHDAAERMIEKLAEKLKSGKN